MSVYDEIKTERDYQDKRWGLVTDDTLNTPWMWASYIGSYATKWMEGSFAPLRVQVTDDFRKKMVKTAALAVAAIESLDRQRAAKGHTFYERA